MILPHTIWYKPKTATVTSIFDGFNRPNNDPIGIADSGQTWIVLSGGFVTKNSRAEATDGGVNLAVLETNKSNGTVLAEMYSTGNSVWLAFRVSDINNYWYFSIRTDGYATLSKVVDGISSIIQNKTIAFVNGATGKVIMDGNSILVEYNGVAITGFNISDMFNVTATMHGIGSFYTETSQDQFNFFSVS